MLAFYFTCLAVLVYNAICITAKVHADSHWDLRKPLTLFSDYDTTIPHQTVNRLKRQLSVAEQDDHGRETIIITAFGREFILDLKLNSGLIARSYIEKYYINDSPVIRNGSDHAKSSCFYHGHIQGFPDSIAAISTCSGISGFFRDNNETYHIEPRGESESNEHFVYKEKDRIASKKSDTHRIREVDAGGGKSHVRLKRELSEPYGARQHPLHVELFLVIDKTMYDHSANLDAAIERAKKISNIVNVIYKPLNIFIVLVGVEVWNERDKIELSQDGDVTLSRFLDYRKQHILPNHRNDNTQLMSGNEVFENSVVGKAYKGLMCSYQYSAGVIADHSRIEMPVASTLAHEMGHNFGMEHDTDKCTCDDKKCVMAASSSGEWFSPTKFSSCSVEKLAMFVSRGIDWCLRNKPVSVFEGPVCGDGYVEEGEQCDCGPEGMCDSPCCNPSTCQLYANATCGSGLCCDLTTCKLLEAGTSCRDAVDECDLPEFCTGQVEFCPRDVTKQDGIPCDNNQGYCYHSSCGSHDQRCKLLWGQAVKVGPNECFEKNTRGVVIGNCGYNRVTDTYLQCPRKGNHVLCGRLNCVPLGTTPVFGIDVSTIHGKSSFFTSARVMELCHILQIDMGLDSTDPGMTPDGALCGNEMMCVSQRCTGVKDVLDIACLESCHGQGVCNNKKHCHCNKGYAPPYCDTPGYGGSEDSGPPADDKGSKNFLIGSMTFFVVLLPVIFVILLIYHVRGPGIPCLPHRVAKRQSVQQSGGGRPRSVTSQHSQASSPESPTTPAGSSQAKTTWPWSAWFRRSAKAPATPSAATYPPAVNAEPLLVEQPKKDGVRKAGGGTRPAVVGGQSGQQGVGGWAGQQGVGSRAGQQGVGGRAGEGGSRGAPTGSRVNALAQSFSSPHKLPSATGNPVKRNQSEASTSRVVPSVNKTAAKPQARTAAAVKAPAKVIQPPAAARQPIQSSWPKPPPINSEEGAAKHGPIRGATAAPSTSKAAMAPVRAAPVVPPFGSKFDEVPLSPTRPAPGLPSSGKRFPLVTGALPALPPRPGAESKSQAAAQPAGGSPSVAQRARWLNDKLTPTSSPTGSPKTRAKVTR